MKKLKQILKLFIVGWIKEPTKIERFRETLKNISTNDKDILIIAAAAELKSGETTFGVAGIPSNLEQIVTAFMNEDEMVKQVLTNAVFKYHLEHHIAEQEVDSLLNELGFDREE